MRSSEFIFEGTAEQDAHNQINKRIIELQRVLKQFDIFVETYGYAANNANEFLAESKKSTFYLDYLVSFDTKLQKSFNKLLKIQQEVVDKINSGV
jgi:hypothetical protein